MSFTEIARLAGVSITTVSRVMNNHPSVRPETASQVKKAMEGISYDRYAVRRGPRPGKRVKHNDAAKTRHIAIVVLGMRHEEWFKQPVFSSVVSGITRAAADRRLNVHITELIAPGGEGDAIRGGLVDGAIVFVTAAAEPGLLEGLRRQVPVVRIMGEELGVPTLDQVRPNNLAVGQLAFNYLRNHGVKEFGFVSTRPDYGPMYFRGVGFCAASRQAGLKPPTMLISNAPPVGMTLEAPELRRKALGEIADRIAAARRGIGVFISQDVETVGLYPLLVERGIRPGHDITLVSCNNDQSLSLLTPRPASVDLCANELGRWAVTRLVNRIARPEDAPVQMLVTPKLVPGDEG